MICCFEHTSADYMRPGIVVSSGQTLKMGWSVG